MKVGVHCARSKSFYARVVKLVDTRDLKSLAGNSVPVRVRPRAPIQGIN